MAMRRYGHTEQLLVFVVHDQYIEGLRLARLLVHSWTNRASLYVEVIGIARRSGLPELSLSVF